jgi:hypothetical protein
MTDAEAFKYGFLLKCAQDGLTETETAARIHAAMAKEAVSPAALWAGTKALGKGISNTFGLAKDVVSGGAKAVGGVASKTISSIPAMIALGLVPPTLIGVLGGYTASKLTDNPYTTEQARRDEELAEYYRALDQLDHVRRQREASGRR